MEWSKIVPELTVTDLQTSLDFYVDTADFVMLFSRNDPAFAYLEFEGGQIMLEQRGGDWETGVLEKPFGRGINLQIECKNVQRLRDQIVAKGHKLYRDLAETWYDVNGVEYGALEFLVQDPDGYLLRFSQDLGTRMD